MPDLMSFLDFMESFVSEETIINRIRSETSRAFISVKTDDEQVPYVEINKVPYDTGITNSRKYILKEGKPLGNAERISFLRFCCHPILPTNGWKEFMNKARETWPQYKLRNYLDCQIGPALEHIYFCMIAPDSPQALLYRAGYENIAHSWPSDDERRKVTSLTEVFGCRVPAKLLEVLNCSWELAERAHPQNIGRTKQIYRQFQPILKDSPINLSQWKYIEALACQGRALGYNDFQKSVYRLLSHNGFSDMFELYEDYLRIIEELKPYGLTVPKALPKPHGVYSKLEHLEKLKELFDAGADEAICKKYYNDVFDYEGEEFIIKKPKNLLDFYNEGEKLQTEIINYAEKYAAGDSSILFVRRKNAPNTPFVDMEISNNLEVLWVGGKNGKKIQARTVLASFLMEFFAVNNISYELYRGDLV